MLITLFFILSNYNVLQPLLKVTMLPCRRKYQQYHNIFILSLKCFARKMLFFQKEQLEHFLFFYIATLFMSFDLLLFTRQCDPICFLYFNANLKALVISSCKYNYCYTFRLPANPSTTIMSLPHMLFSIQKAHQSLGLLWPELFFQGKLIQYHEYIRHLPKKSSIA